ncbi:MAG: T9SS type A sorting domain-containing protein, partial [Rhodothermales bacterium]|nr:T9SS type A sorting domain-containing protein [Rhodothermales bacterium]
SIGIGDYNVGLTVLWYDNLEGGAAGWGEIGGADVRLNGEYNSQVIPLATREATTGWKQYAHVVYPPDDAVGLEMRVRYWHKFTGKTYWDDVAIMTLGGNTLIGTGVEEDGTREVPSTFMLHQNFPNPFNPSTTIAFDMPQSAAVTLSVYNVLGQRVATLVDNKVVPAGRQQVAFDASGLPSGVYLYVLGTRDRTEARTMVLLK